MPKLSSFFGIDIILRTREDSRHVAHFHAIYGNEEVSVEIGTLRVVAGQMSNRPLALVIEWAFQHRPEIKAAWDAVQAGRKPNKIEPLR
ncbi:MAG: DUF4160 domain-containing protein [Chthoniobacteraceae bacterium]|jgi:hypothetical protein